MSDPVDDPRAPLDLQRLHDLLAGLLTSIIHPSQTVDESIDWEDGEIEEESPERKSA